MKRILIPTDFSENAANALQYAIELARLDNSEIILLHAFSADDPDYLVNETNALMKELELKIIAARGIKYKLLCKEGSPVKTILDVIAKKEISLVIMGTKGGNNFANMILGSNTAKVIDRCDCPVIVVPEDVSFKPIKKLTYATDYRIGDLEAVRKLVRIAKPFNAQINILHVAYKNQSPLEEVELMKEFMEKVNYKISYDNLSFQMLAGDDIEEILREYIDADSADILAMSTHHNGLWKKAFGTGLAGRLINSCPVLLMIFHNEKKYQLN